jgi:uncharacterized membrane protein
MPVDVTSEIEIARPRAEVAAFAGDLENVPEWQESIDSVEWRAKKRRPAVGAQVEFVAEVLGRRLVHTYELRELRPGERLVMTTSSGSFPVETTYTWEDTSAGATRMTLRNRGTPDGVSRLFSPFMARAMRRTDRNNLRALKELLEGS